MRLVLSRIGLGWALLSLTACGGAAARPEDEAREAAPTAPEASPSSPAPQASTGRDRAPGNTPSTPPPGHDDGSSAGHFELLPVEGYSPSLLFVPAAEPGERRPVAVVTHGAGGRPEYHCQRWRELLRERAFVLCTRGRTINREVPEEQRGYFYDGHRELGREVDRAWVALSARYGDRVDPAGPLFTGFSQGAAMGILWIHERGLDSPAFSRIVLVEGGSGEWNVALSEKAHARGVTKVIIACGQLSCGETGRRSAPFLRRAGIDVRFEYATGAGHTDAGGVGERVEADLEWLFEGDPRWLGSR